MFLSALARQGRRPRPDPAGPAVCAIVVCTTVVCATAIAGVASQGTLQPPPADPATTRAAFLKLIDRPRVPLAPDIRGGVVTDGVSEVRGSFAADAGGRVPMLLVKREAGAARRPVVIVLHGTGGTKESQSARLRRLAAHGFLAVAIDGRYHGERAQKGSGTMSAYEAAILRAYRTQAEHPFLYDTVWDVMRLIDYLVTRDDVDAARIGLMGISKGGMETYLTAAVDPRIAAAVPLIGVQSFRWGLEHGGWDSRAWTFRHAIEAAAADGGDGVNVAFMKRFYDRVAPGIYGEFDAPRMLPLVAPRPLLAINGDSDPRTPMAGLKECAAAAEQAYAAAGAAGKFALHLQPNAGHEVTPEGDQAAVEWFVRWLKPAS
jgi:dienelactone hydrolase